MFRRLIINLNNFVTRKRRLGIAADSILLLLPHCLQRSKCERNVIPDIDRCERCGKCDIAGILGLRDELGIKCKVVGGGREALRLACTADVRGIVACACEKELLDGILASFPKPVLAVVNTRPNGPCKDTRVKIDEIRSAIAELMRNDSALSAEQGTRSENPCS